MDLFEDRLCRVSHDETISVLLRKSHLADWTGWTSKSEEYLGQCGSHVNLRELVAAYQDSLLSFYRWFDEEMDSFHQAELADAERLRERIAALEDRRG